MKKRVLGMILAAALAGAMLNGCGSTSSAPAPAAQKEETAAQEEVQTEA